MEKYNGIPRPEVEVAYLGVQQIHFLSRMRIIVRRRIHQSFDFRKSVTSLVVAAGFSSIIQWPESGTIASFTSVAAKRITVAIIVPRAASPPIASTGMVSLPLASYALLSMVSWPKAADWAKPPRMAPGMA